MAGTIDNAVQRKQDQDVDRAAKLEQKRRDREDEGGSHATVADDQEAPAQKERKD
jgi:hypothetical protein